MFRYGRDLNSVLKDNLGDNWDEVCCFPQHLSFCVHTRHLLKITSIPTYLQGLRHSHDRDAHVRVGVSQVGGRAKRAILVFMVLCVRDLHQKQIQILRFYVCVTCVTDQFQFISMALCKRAQYLQKNNCGPSQEEDGGRGCCDTSRS